MIRYLEYTSLYFKIRLKKIKRTACPLYKWFTLFLSLSLCLSLSLDVFIPHRLECHFLEPLLGFFLHLVL